MAARIAILFFAVVIVFGVMTAILLRVLPIPHSAADYLVIGTISTLVSLVALFAALTAGWLKMRDVFYRRRRKPSP